jgi:osmoprotectant transport system ATP-binding protein
VRIEAGDLATPPAVAPTATLQQARAVTQDDEAKTAKTAVVVDENGRLMGWVSLEPGIDGFVGAHTEKFTAQVPLGTTLRAALGEMLQHDIRWLPVVDEKERYLGVLTPNRLHSAMRRSVGGTPIES